MRTTWAALRVKAAQTLWQHRPSFPCNFAHVQIAPRRLPVKTPPRSGVSLPGSPRPPPSVFCGFYPEKLLRPPLISPDRPHLHLVNPVWKSFPAALHSGASLTGSVSRPSRIAPGCACFPLADSARETPLLFPNFPFRSTVFLRVLPDNEPCFPRIFSCVQSFLFEGFAGNAPGLSQNFPCGSAASCRARVKPRSSASGKRFHGPCLTYGGGGIIIASTLEEGRSCAVRLSRNQSLRRERALPPNQRITTMSDSVNTSAEAFLPGKS